MDDARKYLGHQMKRMCGHLDAPTSNETHLPQGPPPVLEHGWANAWPPYSTSVPIHYLPVSVEESHAGVNQLSSSSIRATDEAARTYLESLITNTHGEDLPVTSPSNSESMSQTTFPLFNLSTLGGSENSSPAPLTSNEDPRDDISAAAIAGVDKNCNWNQQGVSMDAPLDHSPQYTGAHMIADFKLSPPPTVPGFYRPPTIAQGQEQRVSGEMPQQSQTSGKGPTAESPKSPLRPDEKRRAAENRYRCGDCELDFKQKRGLTRHRRDKHEFSLCIHCDFEWHRHHELKEHLLMQHPDANISDILGDVTRSRREATKIKTRQRDSPLVIEHAGGDFGETGYASWPSPAVVGGVAPASLHASSPIGYEPQPKSAKSTIKKKRKRENDIQESESPIATYNRITFPPSKKRARVEETDLDMSALRVQICVQNTGMLAYPGGCTAATHPFNPRPPPIHTSTAPVGGYDWSQSLVHSEPLPSSSTSWGRPGANVDHQRRGARECQWHGPVRVGNTKPHYTG